MGAVIGVKNLKRVNLRLVLAVTEIVVVQSPVCAGRVLHGPNKRAGHQLLGWT